MFPVFSLRWNCHLLNSYVSFEYYTNLPLFFVMHLLTTWLFHLFSREFSDLSSIVVTYNKDGGETFMIGAHLKAKGWWDTLVLIASLSPWRVCMFGLHLEIKRFRYTLDMCPFLFCSHISPTGDLEGVATMFRWCGHWNVLKCKRSLTAFCFSVVLGTEKCRL